MDGPIRRRCFLPHGHPGRGCERERLLNIVRLKLGIVAEEVVPVRIDRHGFHGSTHRKPYPTNARLAVHLVRVPRYAIKVLHRFHSDTFRRSCGFRAATKLDSSPLRLGASAHMSEKLPTREMFVPRAIETDQLLSLNLPDHALRKFINQPLSGVFL